MRPQWPLLSLMLLTPASTLAGDYRLLNVGVRGGVSGLPVLGKHEHERFQQYDLFATASLPCSRYWESGWGFSTRLMGTAGALTAAGKRASSDRSCPCSPWAPRTASWPWMPAGGAALISRYKFGEQNFGGVFEFVLTFGLRVSVYWGLGVGYRMAHMSDATIHGSHSRGVDIHMLELTYNFAEPTAP